MCICIRILRQPSFDSNSHSRTQVLGWIGLAKLVSGRHGRQSPRFELDWIGGWGFAFLLLFPRDYELEEARMRIEDAVRLSDTPHSLSFRPFTQSLYAHLASPRDSTVHTPYCTVLDGPSLHSPHMLQPRSLDHHHSPYPSLRSDGFGLIFRDSMWHGGASLTLRSGGEAPCSSFFARCGLQISRLEPELQCGWVVGERISGINPFFRVSCRSLAHAHAPFEDFDFIP